MDVVAGRLDLSRRGLAVVPDELFEHAESIEVLDLADNSIADLPPRFAELKRLKAVFLSGNPMARLPPVLGTCPALSQIGARGCGMRQLPAEALPEGLRWLTLTDNALATLPDALGRRPALQKLMLAGNGLEALPASLAGAENLELLRLSANRFAALPPYLEELPRLAWLAPAGNPFERAPFEHASARAAIVARTISWGDLTIGGLLGEGASGWTMRARWRRPGGDPSGDEMVAVKLFKGAMTSDGSPSSEIAACLAAGPHPSLVAALGALEGHPDGRHGLVMPLIPAHWRVLAGPPSLATCSRDVYEPTLRLPLPTVVTIARAVAAAGAHLHGRGLLHGDLYAHNTLWDGDTGAAVLGDLGAASFLPSSKSSSKPSSMPSKGGGLAAFDVLAFGILLGELLDRCRDGVPPALRALEAACRSPRPAGRPSLLDTLDTLDGPGRP